MSRSQQQPFVIAIEGLDGTGKTTQTDMLGRALRLDGLAVDVRSFPVYESFFGSHVGRLLRDSDRDVDPRSTALWFALDRFDALRTDPPTGDVLLLNRFTLSNAVYQTARAHPDEADDVFSFVVALEQQRLGLPAPDLTVFLDLPEEESIRRADARARDRNTHADVYERDDALQRRVRSRYRTAIGAIHGGCTIPCMDTRGAHSPETIHLDVLFAVRQAMRQPAV